MRKIQYATFLLSFILLIVDLALVVSVSFGIYKLIYHHIGNNYAKIAISTTVFILYFVCLTYVLQATPILRVAGYRFYTRKLQKPSLIRVIVRAVTLYILVNIVFFMVQFSLYVGVFFYAFGGDLAGWIFALFSIIVGIFPFYLSSKLNRRRLILQDFVAGVVLVYNDKEHRLYKNSAIDLKKAILCGIGMLIIGGGVYGFYYFKDKITITIKYADTTVKSSKIKKDTKNSKSIQLTQKDKAKAKEYLDAILAKEVGKFCLKCLVEHNLYKDAEIFLKNKSIAEKETHLLLRKAIEHKSYKSAEVLLEYGANIYNSDENSFLNAAYINDKKEILELFIDYGFDIDYSYLDSGYTLLHHFANSGCKNMDLVNCLLKNGANTQITNRGKLALDIAKERCSDRDYNKFKELIATYKNADKNKTYQKLFRADIKLLEVKDSNLSELISKIKTQSRLFVEANSSMQVYEHYFKIDLLTYSIVKRLQELHSPNPYKEANNIKLYTLNSYAKSVDLVKKCKYNLARVSEFAKLKSFYLARQKAYSIIDKNSRFENSFVAMMSRLVYTHWKDKKYKELEKIYKKALDNNPQKAIKFKLILNMLDDWYVDMRYLYQQAKIENETSKPVKNLSHIYKVRQKEKEHPIFTAIEFYDNKRFLQEIKRVKNIELTNRYNQTMLYIAEQNNNNFAIDMLLKRGAKINILLGATKKYSLLSWLMLGGGFTNADNIKELIQKGADVNLRGKNGKTAISIIAQNCKNFRISKLLIDSGANPYIKDAFGLDTFDKVKKCKNVRQRDRMLNILKSYKGKR